MSTLNDSLSEPFYLINDFFATHSVYKRYGIGKELLE